MFTEYTHKGHKACIKSKTTYTTGFRGRPPVQHISGTKYTVASHQSVCFVFLRVFSQNHPALRQANSQIGAAPSTE